MNEVALLIPYRLSENSVAVMLQKRSVEAPRYPGYFGLFGGHIREGEVIEDALVREIDEELSIQINEHWKIGEYALGEFTRHVFCMHITDELEKNIVVREGDYGRWFYKQDIETEEKIILQNKEIINIAFDLIANKHIA